MIKKGFLTLLAVISILLLTGIVTVLSMPAPAAQPVPQASMAVSPSYQLNWDVVSDGGATMNSSSFTMYSSTGQNVTTTMTGSTYTMENGFWHGLFGKLFNFLPIITEG